MADLFYITVKQLSDLNVKLQNAPALVQTTVKAEVKDGANSAAAMAKNLAPADVSNLRQLISAKELDDYSWAVISAAKYAAYVEFGTGAEVFKNDFYQFTDIEKEFAEQYFVSGKGHLPAHPHMFPALDRQLPITVENIRKQLEKIV